MNTPIKSRIKRKNFRSLDAFSSELVKSYGEFEGVNYRILSMRIADLDKGKAVWWQKRKNLLDRVLNVLEMDASDLDMRKAESNRYTFNFQAFPLIPPLDFRVKGAWEIGEPALTQPDSRADSGRYSSKPTLSYWFDSVGIAPRKLQWLHVTDAVEYQLLTHRLTTIGPRDILVEEALGDVIGKHLDRLLDPSPLILVFQTASYDDVVDLNRISRAESPRLIVSSKAVPSPDTHADAQERGNRLSASNSPNTDDKTTPLEIENWLWRLKPNWRALMLKWLDRHFSEHDIGTPFNYEVAHTLLEKFDRDAQWFADVHDVLILSRAIDFHSKEELQDALRSKGRAYDLLQLLLGRNKTQLKLLRQLIAARWKRWDLPWIGSVDESEWNDLSDGHHDCGALEDKGIIARVTKGYDFANPIAARLLLREHLDSVLAKGETALWAPACFDAQRRLMLDATLDAVNPEVVATLSGQLVQDPDAAETLGAVEALFVAIGRRMIRAEPVRDVQLELAGLALKRIHNDRGLALPLSRHLATHEAQLEWIAVCWAWSLAAPPVPGWDHSWLFPGWCAAHPDRMDERLSYPERYGRGSAAERWGNLATPLRAFLAVVARWMTDQKKPPQYDTMPSVFQVALLAHAAAGKWPADVGWWHGILGVPEAEEALCDLVNSWRTIAPATMAHTWWPSLIRHLELQSRSSPYRYTFPGDSSRSSRPALLDRVMALLGGDAQAALQRLSDEDLLFLRTRPDLLTPSFKCALLRLVTHDRRLGMEKWEAPDFLSRFGPDIVPELESLLDHDMLGAYAARQLWEWRTSAAKRMLRTDSPIRSAGVRNLLLTSPRESIAAAIARMQHDPHILADDSRRQWVLARLPDAREHARALLKLL